MCYVWWYESYSSYISLSCLGVELRLKVGLEVGVKEDHHDDRDDYLCMMLGYHDVSYVYDGVEC